MSVGFSQGKGDIDARAGNICLSLRNVLSDVQDFNAFLGTKQHADLTALGYTDAEATELTTNFTFLDQFRQVFEGTQAIPTPVNIKALTTPFTGVN